MEFFFATIYDLWESVHSGSWPELGLWSYILLILLVATEGPVSTLLGAAAAATGILDIRYVFMAAFIGNVLGDCLWYTVGSVNSLERIYRYGRWFGMRKHHLACLEREMHAHATKLIVLSKLAIGLIIPTLVAAGLARVPWRRWFPLVLTIETIWTLLIVNFGFHSAGLVGEMEQGIQMIGAIILVGLVVGVIKYGRHIFQQSEEALKAEPSVNLVVESNLKTRFTKTLAANTAKSASTALDRTTKTIAAKSQAIKASAASVSKPANSAQIHFAGD